MTANTMKWEFMRRPVLDAIHLTDPQARVIYQWPDGWQAQKTIDALREADLIEDFGHPAKISERGLAVQALLRKAWPDPEGEYLNESVRFSMRNLGAAERLRKAAEEVVAELEAT